jgi:hypothetical protein
VHAEPDTRNHPNGITITDQQMEGLERCALRRCEFHGEWNYALVPQRTHHPTANQRLTATEPTRSRYRVLDRSALLALWCHVTRDSA